MADEKEETDNLFREYFSSLADDTLKDEEQRHLVKRIMDARTSLKAGRLTFIERLGRYFWGDNQHAGSKKFILRPVAVTATVLIAAGLLVVSVYRIGQDHTSVVNNKPSPGTIADNRQSTELMDDTARTEDNKGSGTLVLAQIPLKYSDHGFLDSNRENRPTDSALIELFLTVCEKVLAEKKLPYTRQNMRIATMWQAHSNNDSLPGSSRLIVKVNPGKGAVLAVRELRLSQAKDIADRRTVTDSGYRQIVKDIKTRYYSMLEKHE